MIECICRRKADAADVGIGEILENIIHEILRIQAFCRTRLMFASPVGPAKSSLLTSMLTGIFLFMATPTANG